MGETNFIFPLSEREFDALESGQTVKRYYHTFNKKIVLVVCWNKIKTKLKRQDYNHYMRRGISVVNVPLTNRDLKKIGKGNAVTAHYAPFEVTVCLESILEKIKNEL